MEWVTGVAFDAREGERLRAVFASGRHDASLGFTTAYFHTVEQLRSATADAGFVDVSVVGIEGPRR